MKIGLAGQAAAQTLAFVGARIEAGVTTAQIDAWVRDDTRKRRGRPSQLGYNGFPAAVCTSVNHVVCHGIPGPLVLRDGDIVNVDITTELDGFHGDTSRTFEIGTPSAAARHLVRTCQRALEAGIAAVRPGAQLGDIGHAIQTLAHRAGCSVVTDYAGHGIGRQMHEAPNIPHHGRPGTGLVLRPGMTFTIEPMLNLGRSDVRHLDDGWTVVTADGSLSAQFEHTLHVTRNGAEILTDLGPKHHLLDAQARHWG